MNTANAGRVMSTPAVTPTIVVIANPRSMPAPAKKSGTIAAVRVKYDAKMMKNAAPIRSFHVR